MPTIRQIKISHCKSAVRMRNMPKRQDINKIMIIGSGPIIIVSLTIQAHRLVKHSRSSVTR